MSFSSRRRNYLLTPHRRDGLIEWMKSMLTHSFVLDALDTTGGDTFSHFEMLIEEHRLQNNSNIDKQQKQQQPSRLKQLVPTVGTFHTPLPLRRAFDVYNAKYRLTSRRHITISFNELRHILNLAQIMAMGGGGSNGVGKNSSSGGGGGGVSGGSTSMMHPLDSPSPLVFQEARLLLSNDNKESSGVGSKLAPSPPPPLDLNADAGGDDDNNNKDAAAAASSSSPFAGPKMITFDGDQTLYSDGANFESNPRLAHYLYLLLRHGVTVAVVTAAGYEYNVEKYEQRLSGLLHFFKEKQLPPHDCERFYLFGGECNYLLSLKSDYHLHAVKETGPGGWHTSTKYIPESPANWDETELQQLLDRSEATLRTSVEEQRMGSRALILRKRRSVGLIPNYNYHSSNGGAGEDHESLLPREALDETVLRVHAELRHRTAASSSSLPFCAFNGGRDVWVDVGNKRVGVQILQSYLGIQPEETLHIGDQFLNTGNDYAARAVCPCIWITSPEETTYILKSILRLAGVSVTLPGTGQEQQTSSSSRILEKSSSTMSDMVLNPSPSAAVAENEGEISEETKRHFAEVDRRSSEIDFTGMSMRMSDIARQQT